MILDKQDEIYGLINDIGDVQDTWDGAIERFNDAVNEKALKEGIIKK